MYFNLAVWGMFRTFLPSHVQRPSIRVQDNDSRSHVKEEFGWRRVARRHAEEAGGDGRQLKQGAHLITPTNRVHVGKSAEPTDGRPVGVTP